MDQNVVCHIPFPLKSNKRMKSGSLWLYGSSIFLIPFYSSLPVMTVINQLAPTHSFLDVFFFFFNCDSRYWNSHSKRARGKMQRRLWCPPIFSTMCHQPPQLTRGLAKLWTHQSEYYFCGEATLWNRTRSAESTTRLTKRDSCYEFSGEMKNSWTRVARSSYAKSIYNSVWNALKLRIVTLMNLLANGRWYFIRDFYEIVLVLNFNKVESTI